MSDRVAELEKERDRLARALDRTTLELQELLVELDALRRARSAAESANLVRGEILATVSRTMRAPSDTILGLAGLLRNGSLLPTQRAYLDAIHAAAEALRGTLNDVSDLSRLESGTLPLEPIVFDLRVMIEETAASLALQAEAKGLLLRLEWRPDAPRRVSGDPGRLRQVLSALLRDSFGRVERGEVVIEIARGRLRSVGGGVRFTVEDTGPAISDDLLPTLFEPFARADASPWRDSRLALPIAHHLVRLMGGDLEVSNLPASGSRFTFSLPMLQTGAGAEALHPAAVGGELPLPSAPGAGLFVVEADPDQRATWTQVAEAAGFQVSGFASREEALAELTMRAQLGRAISTVIFSDHDAIGYDIIGKQILADERLGRPALIMLPAVGNPGDARRLREGGFRGYLVKPVVPADLRETLEALRRAPPGVWTGSFVTRHTLAESRWESADVELPVLISE